MELHLDFETRSTCDLKKSGLYVYAEDPTTEVILISYAFGDDEVKTWVLGEKFPTELREYVRNGGLVVAHNAHFELEIWNTTLNRQIGVPPIKLENIRCTMAQSYAMALPGSLEKSAAALGIDQQKDLKGQRLMLKMSKPKNTKENEIIEWHWNEEAIARLTEYGRQDVVVERMVDKRQLKLSPSERKLWELDLKINTRGILIDVPSASNALTLVEKEKERLNNRMREVTKGAVSTCSATGQLTDWLHFNKINTEGVAKSDVVELLNDPSLPSDIREALLLRQLANKSSTAKLSSMLLGVNTDWRIRGTLQFHGAGTGRWAGRKLQVQNFPRGKWNEKETEHIFEIINSASASEQLSIFYDNPITVVSDVLRSFICAEHGKVLRWCDFSAIEARVLAWLAGEQSVLDVFLSGKDIYKFAAMKIFGVSYHEVTKAQRQIGKVAVLALGYQGGRRAFNAMAKNYGVKVSDGEAESIKANWRNGHPKIVKYWEQCNYQAIRAVRNPGTKFSSGPKEREVTYLVKGSFLFCQLPSKRLLTYPYPKIEQAETPWGEMRDVLTYMGEDSLTKKWTRQKAYGGLLVENITQAVARDLLAEALFRLEEKNYPVIFHVHDEVVCEVPKGFGSVKEMEDIVSEVPSWAKGLPIAAEGDEGSRYRK